MFLNFSEFIKSVMDRLINTQCIPLCRHLAVSPYDLWHLALILLRRKKIVCTQILLSAACCVYVHHPGYSVFESLRCYLRHALD